MNNYIRSFTQKMDCFFKYNEIVNILYLNDVEDNERLDHVVFFEMDKNDVIGFFIRGMNPLISVNKIDCLDDFNLYASYEDLVEVRENFNLKIEYACLYFNTEFNEIFGCYLMENQNTKSLLVLFEHDRLVIMLNRSKLDVNSALKKKYSNGYLAYEKMRNRNWEICCGYESKESSQRIKNL